MTARRVLLTVLGVAALCGPAAGADDANRPKIYVPYKDIAAIIDPADRAVLMERSAFQKLLAAAEANVRAADSRKVAQVTRATYQADVAADELTLDGTLTVVSMSDEPVSLPLAFAQIGLTKLTLDGKPAPLGYDRRGRLVLIVTGKGAHRMTVTASAVVKELPRGGAQFGMSLPAPTAGEMTLTAPGDLEVHATVPVSAARYDRKADRTTARLTLGGHESLTVMLTGNGRQEDQRAILLGRSATTVELTRSYQAMHCVYTVEVLRRGVRELTFALPADWTVTDATCPSLVKWSVLAPKAPGEPKRLVVRLRTASRGTKILHVQATALRRGQAAWQSPFLKLQDADFQHGYLLVDTGRELRVRGQRLNRARREDLSRAISVLGLVGAGRGQMFYHWSDDWSVRLDLAAVALRRSSESRHRLAVTEEELSVTAEFQVTAVGRELFDLAFLLPDDEEGWHLRSVKVDGKEGGFEYRVVQEDGKRTLKIELAKAVRPEQVARVAIAMRRVPTDWQWRAGSPAREVSLPLIQALAETVSGLVAVEPAGDLDLAPVAADKALKAVTVGRMTALGLGGGVQLAYTYEAPVSAPVRLRVWRKAHRLSAESIGLLTARPTGLTGQWRIRYGISRARARTLYLLVDKSLGRKVQITAPGRHLAGKDIVAPGAATVELSKALAGRYDLWQLTLDAQSLGVVTVDVRYDRTLPKPGDPAPLVRPIGGGQMRISEMLALQASEELAVTVTARNSRNVDAIDLPALPAPASRLLAAYRLETPLTPAGAAASIRLTTEAHDKYAIPAALAAEADLTTYVGPRGAQRTEATFRIANAGIQFLVIRLAKGAELWSVRVAGSPAKPKRNRAGDHLVALPRSAAPQEVKVVYAWCPADDALDRTELAGVTLPGVKVNSFVWRVVPPPGYCITRQFTDMDAVGLHRPVPAARSFWRWVRRAVAAQPRMFRDLGRKVGADFAGAPAPESAEIDELKEDLGAVVTRRKPTAGKPATQPPAPARGRPPAKAPSVQPPPGPADREVPAKEPVGVGYLRVRGRYTLPVELVATPDAGPEASFSSLGDGGLVVGLTGRGDMLTWKALGLAAVLLAGLLRLKGRAGGHAAFIALVLAVSTVLAMWWPGVAYFANGAFWGGLLLIPLYVVVAVVRRVVGVVRRGSRRAAAGAATAALVVAVLLAATSAEAAKRLPPKTDKLPPAVIPYDEEPADAHKATKVLIPYRRFVELWNRAHPDRKIELPGEAVGVSLAGVRYVATLAGERMQIVLTADVKATGTGWAVLPMPMSGLAVTDATLDGKPAKLQVGPKGMVLTLPGGAAGTLRVIAVTTPKTQGRRGSVRLLLPPLPGAVMTVRLPADDLVLEAPGIDGAPSRRKVGEGVEWTVPLSMRRDVQLRWSPKVGAGAADRTLSAAVAHKVSVYHWATIGVSKMVYSFSAGRNDRFGLLVPAGTTLTGLSGANLRDYRVVGEKTLDGRPFQVVEVRLHRPATKQYELTARWVRPLPALDAPVRLPVPRAADVGRESGTVVLHAVGGMTVKVTDVVGGRRRSTPAAQKTAGAEQAVPVAEYYWPYRPFALTVQLSRDVVRPKVRLDQLVRINRRQVELVAQVHLSTARGRVFGASFVLPDGYELLSAIGPAVEDHHEQPTPAGRRLHVNFRSGVTDTTVALMLVRKDAELGRLTAPTVTAIDAGGEVLSDQTGRLAVQVAASLEAQTLASENLRSVAPRSLQGWLNRDEARGVRFAYEYEKPVFSLRLLVRPKPTKVRVEVFGALTVRPTSAWYSYRLRYTIDGTPIDEVRFTLPTRCAALVEVTSPSLRSVAKAPVAGDPARTQWTVALTNEVTGVLDVSVNFSMSIDPTTRRLEVPRIETEAPEGYRAIIAVQNASRHELGVLESQTRRLTPLPRSQQVSLLTEQIRRSLQLVRQSFARDWSMVLTVKPAKVAARVRAMVDLMALTTVVDRTGRYRYEVRLALQNRSEQFLRVKVPGKLELWSATVAGQPVKPVTDAAAGADVVLIPLVKTSPGGLPYDVMMYFAGRRDETLGWLAKLEPPAVRVLGIDVERTTWSLRLPTGYRYVGQGGNLSPVVTALESRLVAIDARLGQLKRFQRSYGELVASESVRRQDVGRRNWKLFNKDVAQEIQQLQADVEGRKAQLGGKDYDRLTKRLRDQSSFQYGLNVVWDRDEQAILRQDRANINDYLNVNAGNAGVAETTRNATLEAMPEFVRRAAEKQKANIAQELKVQTAAVGATVTTAGDATLGGEGVLVVDQNGDKRVQVAQVLEKLQVEQHRKQLNRQKELEGQLSQVLDNRMIRHYVQGGQRGVQRPARPGEKTDQPAQTVAVGRDGRAVAPGTTYEAFVPRTGLDRRRRGGPAAIRPTEGPAVRGEGKPGGVVETGGAPAGAGALAVARGTFSLPVSLPAGGERRDYQGPTGEPRITIWAVDDRLIEAACGTGVVLVLAVIVWLLSRLWVQFRHPGEPAPRGLLPGYLLLAALLVALTGVVSGIVLAAAVACPVELIHRLLNRRAARARAAA